MKKRIITVLSILFIICAFNTAVSAEATLSASTTTPVTGQQITFTVGTTQQGLDALINTTGLSYVSNTGLGNSNHVITVPGMGSTYTYTVTASPGETVSFILSNVNESDADGNEMPGQRAVWMATAVGQQEPPSQEPTPPATGDPTPPTSSPGNDPTDDPTNPPSNDPTDGPTNTPEPPASNSPGPGDPGASPTPVPPPSGNPSPTINPGTPQDGNNSQNSGGTTGGGTTGGGTTGGGTTGSTGGTAGGTTNADGGAPPKTGDLTHFLALLGIIGALLLIIVIAGRKVFAEE